MLYHISKTPGLTVLQPRVSSHQKAYVYATDDLVIGLLFGAPKDDFDLMIYTNEEGTPVVCECYPNAFEKIYKGKNCFVYEVQEEGFQRGVTGWMAELVCEKEVAVQGEWVISDLYTRLLEEEQKDNLIVQRYSDDIKYKKMISEHIVDRLIRFDGCLENLDIRDERGNKYFRGLIDGLKSVMDGHLL